MKLVITGATSMLGTALVEVALKQKDEIYAIIRPDTNRRDRLPISENIHLIEKEIDQLQKIDNLPDDCDCFYHLAWCGTEKSTRDHPYIQAQNILFTLQAVELARKCGCNAFLGAGSQAEYGVAEGIIDEKTKCEPASAYGISKLAAGRLSRKLCDGYNIKHIWARIFSVYGRYDSKDSLISFAIRRFINKEFASFQSNGEQLWDYLYEKDAGHLLWNLMNNSNQSDVFNVASGHVRTIREYIRVIAEFLDAKELYSFSNKETWGLQADTTKLRDVTKIEVEDSFNNDISAIINSFQIDTGE